MAKTPDHLQASFSRPIRLRKRPDLTATRQQYLSRSYWIVKEPVGLKYFRFEDEEFAILEMLDGQRSLKEIKEEFEARFPPQKTSYQALQQFVGMLHRSGLILADAPDQGPQLKKRRDERRRKERLALVANPLAIRFKGFDPERVLNFFYPYTSWLFWRSTLIVLLLIGMGALLTLTLNFEEFVLRLPAFEEFFGPSNWIWLGLTLGTVKVLHEFGHGLSCKHFGGECHEMGLMFLVLTPCLYCNVSDSWLLPNKWHRAAIGAAGIFVELTLAAIATFVWWFTGPGLLNHLALQIMFICSISTILFNGNPLLRYDGYYVCSDILEVPNLRQKATSVLKRKLGQICLGLEMPPDPFLPKRNQWLFALYTVAAVAYRWFVLFSILWFLNRVFEPYGLQIIGRLIMASAIVGLFVVPIVQLVKFLHVPGRMDQVKPKRVYATAGVVVAVLAGILLIPLPNYVHCPCYIQARDAKEIYVEVPGRVVHVAVRPGETVDAGAELARLENSALELSVEKLKEERDDLQARATALNRLQYDDAESGSALPKIADALETAEKQLADKQRQLTALQLTAPAAGMVIPPPSRPNAPAPQRGLSQWSGTPFDDRNRGVLMEKTQLFCRIGDPEQLEVVFVIDQYDLELVESGQHVGIKLEAYAGETFETKVTKISHLPMQFSPKSLSNQAGGDLATKTTKDGYQTPISASYQASAPIDSPSAPLYPDMRGRARISTGWQPLGSRLWRYAMKTFHFDL